MKNILIFIFTLLLTNCSLNKDSNYWNQQSNHKEFSNILEKNVDISTMSLKEYRVYIDEHTKKSKYPDISK